MTAEGRRSLTPGLPIIELFGVDLSFGATPVLLGLDLTIRCGERVAVIGPSGSGKSTLVRCMNGLAVPQKGAVKVFGADLRRPAALAECRLRSEMIFQSFHLYAQRSVLDNVTLAPIVLQGMPRTTAEAAARRHLEAMEIGDLAEAYPFQLSGGQQQRVALARALAKGPDILLLDEPTSALDPERVQGVLAAIERATAKGITTVTVTHELGFARRQADRLVFMEGGRIVEDGPPAACLDAPRSDRLRAFLAHRMEARGRPLAPAPGSAAMAGARPAVPA